jgi:hypothetical protein
MTEGNIMNSNHVLFFIWNGPREGREPQAIENMNAVKAFWAKRQKAGDIAHSHHVMLASTGNHNMPTGFLLVTGERAALQQIRWEDEEFLKLHTTTMTTMKDYACIDGYTGESLDKHLQRLTSLMKK